MGESVSWLAERSSIMDLITCSKVQWPSEPHHRRAISTHSMICLETTTQQLTPWSHSRAWQVNLIPSSCFRFLNLYRYTTGGKPSIHYWFMASLTSGSAKLFCLRSVMPLYSMAPVFISIMKKQKKQKQVHMKNFAAKKRMACYLICTSISYKLQFWKHTLLGNECIFILERLVL